MELSKKRTMKRAISLTTILCFLALLMGILCKDGSVFLVMLSLPIFCGLPFRCHQIYNYLLVFMPAFITVVILLDFPGMGNAPASVELILSLW